MKTETRTQGTHSANRFGGETMKTAIIENGISRLLGTSILAATIAFLPVTAAHAVSPATIDNTATVTGDSPTGTDDVTSDSNDVEVDLEDPTNTLDLAKSAAITTDADFDGLGDSGDVITYTYTVENTGNTTLTLVGVNDTHDGSAALATPTFSSWTTQAGSPAATAGVDTQITMNPGAIAVFTTTYTITATDILDAGGGGSPDNDIDNSAVAEGTRSVADDTVSAADTAQVVLDINSSLAVAKAAYEGGVPPLLGGTGTAAAAERPAGTVITYVYTVTNDGNVPIANVGLTDVHSGQGSLGTITYDSLTNTSGSSVYTSGNQVDLLYPGDVAYFTATYTILQADIDAQ